MAWASTLAPHRTWRAFAFQHGLNGAKLLTLTRGDLDQLECPYPDEFWGHVLQWRYVVTVPLAYLISTHHPSYDPHDERPTVGQDWAQAQQLFHDYY